MLGRNPVEFRVVKQRHFQLHGRSPRATDTTLISGLFSLPLSHPPEAHEDAPRAANGPRTTDQGEAFLAGPENILVRSLANDVACEMPSYNPLVLCGPSGVGKTAVAHALVARRREQFQLKAVITTTGSDFARSLAGAIENDSVADLRKRYQRCDVLLIDDLHRLATKPAAQQFLLSVLDMLIHRGVLVLVTLRQLPQSTTGLLPNLASRLAGGLVVPLAPPGLLARQAIVRHTADRHALALSDDVLAQLTSDESLPRSAITAPRLRHAVLQLAASSKSSGRAIRPAQVTQFLAAETPAAKSVAKQITTIVAKHAQLAVSELKGKSRQQSIADARGLAMFLIRRLTQASYAEIGRQFGNRDHTTVLHACQKYERKVQQEDETRRLVADLTAQIAAGEAS
jgi:chromosomal replication initiator protein